MLSVAERAVRVGVEALAVRSAGDERTAAAEEEEGDQRRQGEGEGRESGAGCVRRLGRDRRGRRPASGGGAPGRRRRGKGGLSSELDMLVSAPRR